MELFLSGLVQPKRFWQEIGCYIETKRPSRSGWNHVSVSKLVWIGARCEVIPKHLLRLLLDQSYSGIGMLVPVQLNPFSKPTDLNQAKALFWNVPVELLKGNSVCGEPWPGRCRRGRARGLHGSVRRAKALAVRLPSSR